MAPIDRWPIMIVTVWLSGAAGFLIWAAGGWMHVRRFRRIRSLPIPAAIQHHIEDLTKLLNVRCAVRIVDHFAVAAPLTLGAIRPIVFLPLATLTGLTPAHLRAILAHEMAHIRRMDFVVNLLQVALETALFYHPAVWWVSRQVRQEREYCCDDLAAHVSGNAVTYARALAHLEALRGSATAAPALALSSQGGSLMKRIARLTGSPLPRAQHARWQWRSLAGGAALALIAAGSSAFALAKQAAPAPTPAASSKAEFIEVRGMPLQSQFAAKAENALLYRVVAGEPIEGDGEWQAAESVEGEWVFEAVEFQGDVEITTNQAESAQWLMLKRPVLAEIAIALTPCIDPERMPSEGLVQAAKFAYPFDLLGLMPWVAPEATDVLVRPSVGEFQCVEGQPIGLLRSRVLTSVRANTLDLKWVVDGQPLEGTAAVPARAARLRTLNLLLAPTTGEVVEGVELKVAPHADADCEATSVVAGKWLGENVEDATEAPAQATPAPSEPITPKP